MPIRIKYFLFLLLLLPSPAWALPTVTLMADSNISVAIAEIARRYSRERDVVVNISFAPAKAQEAQITEGAAADILITPNQVWIEDLKNQGLVDIYSQAPIARDRLALVGPSGSKFKVKLAKGFPAERLIEMIGGKPGLVVASPEALPEGSYSIEALHKMNVAAVLQPYIIYAKDRETIFQLVTRDQAYGLFFYSAMLGRSGIHIIDTFPENTHQPIWYYGVAIAGDNMEEARKFLDYLKSRDARDIFKVKGFLTN